MTDEVSTLASDIARPYVKAAIAKHGRLPRAEFEVLITVTSAHALK
jgi:hypothetical protein